jgi:Cd2+/Zn2+-exporting ATPase
MNSATDICTSPADGASRETASRLVWALVGGVFVLNSFLANRLFKDDGMSSIMCALVGLVILLLPMIGIVLRDLRKRELRMNELVVLSVLAGASRGDFRTAGLIAFFMLISLIIESRTASGASASLEALAKVSPGKARRLNAKGEEEEVDPASLVPGDLLRLRPGENVLADGEIVSGNTSLQEANITGESLPVDKGPADTVFAGTVNLSGAIEVRVSRAGKDTTLGRVRELILAAEKTRLPFVRIVDRYVRFYTPVVLMLAFMSWIFTDDLTRVVAFLVVTCPIALILATPSAMVAALAAAARLGVLIKNVNDIEGMARIDAFVFDKTGTLTTSTLSVSRLSPVDGTDAPELVRMAASAERQSNHPVAVAVCALAKKVNVPLSQTSDVREVPGRGLRAVVDGHEICIGNWPWMAENGCQTTDFKGYDDEEHAGMSLLFVLKNGRPLGWLGLEDCPRREASDCIAALRDLKIKQISLVTGDRKGVAAKMAERLDIQDWRGECIPADKVTAVEELKRQGHRVAFVGDGVNDGPALAASNIGIAMGAAGSDVAIESATVALMNSELSRLPFLVHLSKASRAVIFQNFALGGLAVIGGAGLSLSGWLSPVLAAVLQACGSFAVVMNSARLVRQGEDLQN